MVCRPKLSPPKWHPKARWIPSPHPISQTTTIGQRHQLHHCKPHRRHPPSPSDPLSLSYLCSLPTLSALGRSKTLSRSQVHRTLKALPFTPQCVGITDRQSRMIPLPLRATSQLHAAALSHSRLRTTARAHPKAGNQLRRRSVPLPTLGGALRPPPRRSAGGLDRMPGVGPCCSRRLRPSPSPAGVEAWGAPLRLRVCGAAGTELTGRLLAPLTKSPRDNRLLGGRVTGALGAMHPDAVLT